MPELSCQKESTKLHLKVFNCILKHLAGSITPERVFSLKQKTDKNHIPIKIKLPEENRHKELTET